MIAVVNSLPVKEGAAGRIVERVAESRGHVQRFLGFFAMEVMRPGGATRCSWSRAGRTGSPSTPGCGARS